MRALIALGSFIAAVAIILHAGFMRHMPTPTANPKAKSKKYDRIGTQTPRNGLAYTIEITRFDRKSEADLFIARWREKGVPAYYTPVQEGARVEYIVRRGIYGDAQLARREVQKLAQEFNLRGQVVELRN